MPGRAMRTQKKSFEVVLNFGIVDIFQSYDVSKRIEHLYRSIQYDRHSITAVNPKKYSSRFQDFLGKVFKAEDSINAYPVSSLYTLLLLEYKFRVVFVAF